MPVISPRRYSTTTGSSYLPPTTGTYRSTYSTTTSSTKDRGSTSYTTDISTSYGSRSNYFSLNRSTLGNSSSSTSGTTTSKYGSLTSKYLRASADKELPPTGSTSRYPRGDSRTRDRDLTSSGNTPSSSLRLATTAADLYEKYSPSSYIPKCELTRSRSLSEAQKLTKEKTPTKDTSYNSSSGTGGTASSLSKVKLCALTSSPPPIPTHLNNNNNNNIINNNIINYNNNKTTSSVSNHNSAYFGLNINNNNNNKQQPNTLDACIATTNAATPFIIDSFSNKSTKLTTSDVGVYATAMNPINNNQFIPNNSLSSARTKNLYNMKGTSGSMTTTTTRTILSNFSNSSSSDKQTTYKPSFSNNSNGSSSNKDMLKNEIDLVRSQLKSKSSEINNNSHKLLSSSTKSISNNLNNNNINSNNVNNNTSSISNHNGHHTNGISKITLPVKPLIHSKTSLLIKQNSLSNELMANGGVSAGGGSGGASRHTSGNVSELEAVTSKVLNSRTKFLPKTISSSNGDGSDLTGDEIKFIDTDDTTSNERLNRDALTSISTIRLLPTTPATKLFKTNDSSNENDKLFTTTLSSSSLSSSPPPPPPPPTNININNSDDIKQQNSTSADSGIDSSNGSSNSSSSTWDSTATTITSVNTTATTPLMNGNGTATPTTPTGLMTNSTRSVSNLSLQPATNLSTITNDDKISTTTKLIETDFDNSDSYRNASSRAALPPSSERSSKYWERERPSLTSRTLSDSDTFALSKSAFTSSSSLADSYDRGTSTETADGLCGLRNIGNTCFMNSVLQCLSHTNELTKFLRNQYSPKTSTKDQRILAEFVKLIKDMWSGSRSVTPLELKSAISSKYRMYSGSAQQDAQEFLRFFLDTLHCALNTGSKGEKLEIDDNLSDTKKADLTWEWYSRVENSLVKDLFVGQLKSSLKCTVCGNTSVTFDPFWDLSLPLPSSTTRCKLESCLDLFIKEEVLDGDEMPTCSKCKTRRKSTKTFTIQRFPKYLVIHLKRFSETRWSKLTTIVEFPTGERELEMSPYASPSNTSSSKYTLYGISNHMGSTAGGHYVAVCKHPILKKWHEFNDNVVSDSSDYNLVSSSAYLLFYERS